MKIYKLMVATMLLIVYQTGASTEMTTQTYDSKNLTGLAESSTVTFAAPGSLLVTQGETAFLEVSGDTEVLARLSVAIDKGHLTISLPKRRLGLTKDSVDVRLTLPTPKNIINSGSGNIQLHTISGAALNLSSVGSGELVAKRLKTDLLTLDLNGSGKLRFDNITATDMTFTRSGSADSSFNKVTTQRFKLFSKGSGDTRISHLQTQSATFSLDGSGDVYVSGDQFASEQNIAIKGAGEFYGRDFKSQVANVNLNGGGVVEVHAAESIKASSNGAGDIRYYGEPAKVETQIKGSGTIVSGALYSSEPSMAANQ